MPLLMFDSQNFSLYIRCKPDEVYEVDSEVLDLVDEAEKIKQKQIEVNKEVQEMLKKCTEWTRKYDVTVDEALRKKEGKKDKSKKKNRGFFSKLLKK